MGKILDMYARLQGIQVSDVEAKVLEVLDTNKEQIVDLNKSQLMNSEDSDGEPLGEYASIAYANKKGTKDVNLKLTGALYDSIFVKTESFPIVFGATDKKAPDLVDKYGDIFGLNKESTGVVSHTVVKKGITEWFRGLLHV